MPSPLPSAPSRLLRPIRSAIARVAQFDAHRLDPERFVAHLKTQLVPLPYKQWHTVIAGNPGMRVRLAPAGHILGSSICHFHIGDGIHNIPGGLLAHAFEAGDIVDICHAIGTAARQRFISDSS